MDLFRDIKKGKFGNNKRLKREATHELDELGGEERAEKYEKDVKKIKANSKGKALESMKGKLGKAGMSKSHYSGKYYQL